MQSVYVLYIIKYTVHIQLSQVFYSFIISFMLNIFYDIYLTNKACRPARPSAIVPVTDTTPHQQKKASLPECLTDY